ncbi:MAG: glycosyltransferase family 4 protein, partial [Tepidisphaeraceae bacterium]
PGPSKARSNGNDSAPTRLLFVGGQFARKGGPALIEAFRALPESCELDLVTKDRDAERAAGAFGGRVRVHGEMLANSAELRDLYARADLFVLPTRGDCTPVAVIEALAAGLPVVATKLAGIPEQVEDGTNGLLVPPDDAAALAGALRTLVDDAPRRRNMANAARRRAEQAFDGEVNCRALTTLMKRCVDHHQHSLSRSRERG